MALHSELLPTAAVTTLVAVTITALVTPPDPVLQSVVGIALVGVALGVAVVLTVGGGFARAGLAPAGRDHLRTIAGFLAVVITIGVLVPNPTGLALTVGAPLLGTGVGAWLGWAQGWRRLAS